MEVSSLDFGKRTSQESYFGGKLVSKAVTYSVPIRVQTKTQALDEIIKSLDVVTSGKTEEVTLKIECDKKHGGIRLITKTYTVDE